MNREVVLERAKREILADVARGLIPASCSSFSELYDHVDANGYGGAFEEETVIFEFWESVQIELDQWIKHGGLKSQRFNDYDLEIPKFALDLGFIDQSWHNDAAAHMSKGRLHLWVAEVDPEQREYPQAPRFTLEISESAEDYGYPVTLLRTDSEEQISTAIRAFETVNK